MITAGTHWTRPSRAALMTSSIQVVKGRVWAQVSDSMIIILIGFAAHMAAGSRGWALAEGGLSTPVLHNSHITACHADIT